jgi:hypothetical protein
MNGGFKHAQLKPVGGARNPGRFAFEGSALPGTA